MTFPRKQIIEWAREASAEGSDGCELSGDAIEDFAALIEQAARADEREKCEAACEAVARKYQQSHYASAENIADECVSAIRERNNK